MFYGLWFFGKQTKMCKIKRNHLVNIDILIQH